MQWFKPDRHPLFLLFIKIGATLPTFIKTLASMNFTLDVAFRGYDDSDDLMSPDGN